MMSVVCLVMFMCCYVWCVVFVFVRVCLICVLVGGWCFVYVDLLMGLIILVWCRLWWCFCWWGIWFWLCRMFCLRWVRVLFVWFCGFCWSVLLGFVLVGVVFLFWCWGILLVVLCVVVLGWVYWFGCFFVCGWLWVCGLLLGLCFCLWCRWFVVWWFLGVWWMMWYWWLSYCLCVGVLGCWICSLGICFWCLCWVWGFRCFCWLRWCCCCCCVWCWCCWRGCLVCWRFFLLLWLLFGNWWFWRCLFWLVGIVLVCWRFVVLCFCWDLCKWL